jgi:hypothetical protein
VIDCRISPLRTAMLDSKDEDLGRTDHGRQTGEATGAVMRSSM